MDRIKCIDLFSILSITEWVCQCSWELNEKWLMACWFRYWLVAWSVPSHYWTNAGILIGPLGTNFSEILTQIHKFSFKKIHLKMSSGKWRPFCLDLNVLAPVSSCGYIWVHIGSGCGWLPHGTKSISEPMLTSSTRFTNIFLLHVSRETPQLSIIGISLGITSKIQFQYSYCYILNMISYYLLNSNITFQQGRTSVSQT